MERKDLLGTLGLQEHRDRQVLLDLLVRLELQEPQGLPEFQERLVWLVLLV